MIPSTTKLTLLVGVVMCLQSTLSHPVRYDQRQDGTTNYHAELENIVIALLPSRQLLNTGINLLSLGKGARSQTDEVISISDVKSDDKVEGVDVKTVKKDLKPTELDESKKEVEKKKETVKKEDKVVAVKKEKPEKIKKEPMEEEKKDDIKKAEGEKVAKKSEKVVQKMKLVGEGIEDCGPDGKRDAEGKCVF